MASAEENAARLAQVIGVDGMSTEEMEAVNRALAGVSAIQDQLVRDLGELGIASQRRRDVWSRIIAAIAEGINQRESGGTTD